MANVKKPFDADYIRRLTVATLGHTNEYEIAALSSVIGLYLQRIHNKGEASDGSPIGIYESLGHIKKRQELGRQISKKDLELHGNLRRSVKIGVSEGKNVIGFDVDLSRLIAEGQEKQTGKVIYDLQNGEQAEMDEAYARELEFVMNQIENI